MNLLFLLLLFFPIPNGNTKSDVWPGFRGRGDSHSTAKKLPLEWSDTKNKAWDIALPGYGQSSPIVWRNRVFVTAIDGPNKEQGLVLCYDLKSGRELWRKAVATTEKVKVGNTVSQAAPTPIVDDKRLYVFFETGDFYTFDHNGKPLWEKKIINEYGAVKGPHGLGSSLAANDKAIFLAVSHLGPSFLLALNKQDGVTLWKTERKSGLAWGTPLVLTHQGREQIAVRSGDNVTSYDTTDGKSLWFATGLKGSPMPSPTLAGDILVIGAEAKEISVAIKLGGSGDVTNSHVIWRAEEASSYFNSPLVHQNRVYFISKAGIAYCLNLQTGKELWRQRLGVGECWASPLLVGDRLYIFTNEGKTIVLRAGDKFEPLAMNTITDLERVYGVAAVDGALLLRSGKRLIRLSER